MAGKLRNQVVLIGLILVCIGCEPDTVERGGNTSPAETTPAETTPAETTPADLSSDVQHSSSAGALAILDAAIKASGIDEANFSKVSTGRTKMEVEGQMQPGLSGNFLKVDVFDLPGKHKRTVTGAIKGQPYEMNVVINGDTAWMQQNGGDVRQIPVYQTPQRIFPGDNLGVLLDMKQSRFELSVIPSKPIDNRPVNCIRVKESGQVIAETYFDQKTHLVVASKKELFDMQSGRMRKVETSYSNYQQVDGMQVPMSVQMKTDGKLIMKIRVLEVNFLNEIDESEFAKPSPDN